MHLPLAIANALTAGEIRLPLEVQHRILGKLWNERLTLSSCSLVCKAWSPICRKLLFFHIVLRSDFAQFLQNSSQDHSSIAHCIQKVTFSGIIQWPDTVHLGFSVLSLSNLQELIIQRSTFQPAEQPTLPNGSVGLLSRFLSVTKIVLKGTNFFSFCLFAQYIEHFTNLKDLELDNLSWDQLFCQSSDEYPDEGSDLKPLSIQKLALGLCDDNRVVLNWLRHGVISEAPLDCTAERRRPLDYLSCLSIPDVLPREVSQVLFFATTISDSLEHFELGFVLHGIDQTATNAIQKAVEQLSLLHVKSFILPQINLFQFPFFSPPTLSSVSSNSSVSSGSHSPYAWVPSLLEAALSNKLTHLTIQVWLSTETQMDLLNWPLIDSIISVSQLNTLRFQISGIGRSFSLVEAWFKTRLALVATSSDVVIEFDFCHDLHGDRL